MHPHYNHQSSRANATPSSDTFPIVSNKEIPPSPPGGQNYTKVTRELLIQTFFVNFGFCLKTKNTKGTEDMKPDKSIFSHMRPQISLRSMRLKVVGSLRYWDYGLQTGRALSFVCSTGLSWVTSATGTRKSGAREEDTPSHLACLPHVLSCTHSSKRLLPRDSNMKAEDCFNSNFTWQQQADPPTWSAV